MTADAVVIIPTYNEAKNIASALTQVLDLPGIDILVVDDSSTDGTAEIVASVRSRAPERIHVLSRPGKQGLGTAYLAGFEFALEKGYTYVCEMDADLSHQPADLPSLIAPIRAGNADLVVGSRYVQGVRVINWPLSRLILSYGAGIYTRMITRLPVADVTAGFKCYHRKVLEAIPFDKVRSNGYSFQIEMKYWAWKLGFRLKEVPIIFIERTEGDSKMSRAIVVEAMWKVWELRLRSLTGRMKALPQ
ncbi:MAG: polyprenol monophosphomannose synthase [Rhodothermales bacterium]|nr:polyprenol monophosphomannose synthase [Rhodothermales bacterium]MBO6780146.1 polyprenol monophosphomannose synthase [Rhodothermales bacterium]